MADRVEPIRVKISRRNQTRDSQNPRDEFWRSIIKYENKSYKSWANKSISELEGILCMELGSNLSGQLVSQMRKPLEEIDRAIRSGYPEIDMLLHESRRNEGKNDLYPIFEYFSKELDLRKLMLEGNPTWRTAQERVATASAVFFSVVIDGYGSLKIELATSSIPELYKVFEGQFDAFRVFLEAFIPHAFGDVFDDELASEFEFDVTIPASMENAFSNAATVPQATTNATARTSNTQGTSATTTTPREKAEWIWKLANGSLLIPVLIALIVMYFGIQALTAIETAQNESIKPILENSLKLLEEDRLRFSPLTRSERDIDTLAQVKAENKKTK